MAVSGGRVPNSGACALEVARFALGEDDLQLRRLVYSKVGMQIWGVEVLLGDGIMQIETFEEINLIKYINVIISGFNIQSLMSL